MDISRARHLDHPSIVAQCAPVFWEPVPGSGERLCAIIAIRPDLQSTTLLSPGAHLVINARRLRAMLGTDRGNSAHGILMEAARAITHRLLAGAEFEDALPLFRGFDFGRGRQVRGFTAEQVVDTAVNMFAAFGSADELAEEVAEAANISTATTRAFLERVQTDFAPAGDERRARFLRRVNTSAGTFTLDYVFKKHLVQFVSAPVTERQSANMRREAESKILEGLSVQKTLLEGQGAVRLIINTTPLHTGVLSGPGMTLAEQALDHYKNLAKLYHLDTAEAASHEVASLTLATLD